VKASNTHPICATCGDRIGVYEPLWAEQADGTLICTGMLEINRHMDGEQDVSRLYHFGCLPAEQLRTRAA
jgi:hypothetical protein